LAEPRQQWSSWCWFASLSCHYIVFQS
jgi:hypothetical protein